MDNTVIITGGAGFIGSAVIRHLLQTRDCDVVNVDSLTYAGNIETTNSFRNNPKYHFEHRNICDKQALPEIFNRYQPRAIMHLAAESHVDRSIDGPLEFIETNIVGTYNLLEVCRQYLGYLTGDDTGSKFRFHHISTDEVFGTLGDDGLFTVQLPRGGAHGLFQHCLDRILDAVKRWQVRRQLALVV